MPDIAAITRDGKKLTFPCSGAASVLDAAEEAGDYLPSVCRHGRCGTCHAHVLSGAYELAPHEAKLPPGPGGVLLCRCRPLEDLVVELPCRDAQVGRRQLPRRHAMLGAVTTAPEGWTSLTLHLCPEGEFGAEADFAAGQYIELRLPGTEIWRPLPMANAPNLDGVLEFLLPPGADTAWAAAFGAIRRGTKLQLRGPLGSFTLDEKSSRPRCLVGGGAGLAPVLAMLAHLATSRDRIRVHCVLQAAPADRPFLEPRLAALRAALPQLTAALVTANEGMALCAELARLPAADFYAAGPAPLLGAVKAALQALGNPPGRLHLAPTLSTEPAAASVMAHA